jgi:hypothetical protein
LNKKGIMEVLNLSGPSVFCVLYIHCVFGASPSMGCNPGAHSRGAVDAAPSPSKSKFKKITGFVGTMI